MARYHSTAYGKKAYIASKIRAWARHKELSSLIPENKNVYHPKISADAVVIIRLKGQPQMQFSTSRTPFGWTISPTLAGQKVQQVLLNFKAVPFALFLLCLPCFGMDRWTALAMIESGQEDFAVGVAGEISRFQILKSEWRRATPLPYSAAVNPFTALKVAMAIQDERCRNFQAHERRSPRIDEWFVLWNAPAQIHHRSPMVRERTQRFVNLCQRK